MNKIGSYSVIQQRLLHFPLLHDQTVHTINIIVVLVQPRYQALSIASLCCFSQRHMEEEEKEPANEVSTVTWTKQNRFLDASE